MKKLDSQSSDSAHSLTSLPSSHDLDDAGSSCTPWHCPVHRSRTIQSPLEILFDFRLCQSRHDNPRRGRPRYHCRSPLPIRLCIISQSGRRSCVWFWNLWLTCVPYTRYFVIEQCIVLLVALLANLESLSARWRFILLVGIIGFGLA